MDCVVTPLKTLMGFSVHLNVQLKFYNLPNTDRQTKDVRLDILVRDKDNRIYNIEMQVADQDNLGRRMRYYLSKVDAHYTLEKNESYNDLKETYIIFLCNFDYPGQSRLRYVFHEYEDQDRSLMLPANSANPLAVASTLTMHSRKWWIIE